MPIGKKEWVAHFEGHEIRVINTWFGGARLLLDGECLATSNDLFSVSTTRPLLTAPLCTSENATRRIEVFIVTWVTTKAKICVDGQQVGGDSFP
jgi:hypothetical protein